MQVVYDPTQISYHNLLVAYWASPTLCGGNRFGGARDDFSQYKSIIFFSKDSERKLALESRAREALKRGRPVTTEIRPTTTFYLAADYHQKHYLRMNVSLRNEFLAMYPDATEFMNSTAAARVNGYVQGHGSEGNFRKDLDRLGLSDDGRQTLRSLWLRAR